MREGEVGGVEVQVKKVQNSDKREHHCQVSKVMFLSFFLPFPVLLRSDCNSPLV